MERNTRYTEIWHSFSSLCEFLSPVDCWFGPVISILSQVIYPTWAGRQRKTPAHDVTGQKGHSSSWTNDIGMTMELGLFNLDERRLGADLTTFFHSLKGIRARTKAKLFSRAKEQGNGHKGKVFTMRVLKQLPNSLWHSILRDVQNLPGCVPKQTALAQKLALLWAAGWIRRPLGAPSSLWFCDRHNRPCQKAHMHSMSSNTVNRQTWWQAQLSSFHHKLVAWAFLHDAQLFSPSSRSHSATSCSDHSLLFFHILVNTLDFCFLAYDAWLLQDFLKAS